MFPGENRGALRAFANRALVVLGACLVLGATDASAQCGGDCDGNGSVSISELIRSVGIALGNNPLTVCVAIDGNNNGSVAISELIRAVNNALFGCNVTPPTPTPAPVVYSSVCTLADTSTLTLNTGLLSIPLAPLATLDVDCTEAGNDLSCGCSVDNFDPVNIIGIGDVCIKPFSPCEARVADCDGDSGIDVTVQSDHNIGACTGTNDCATKCDAFCDGLGAGYFKQNSTCEDFCLGGTNNGATCQFDANCPGGSCGGPEGGNDGAICECVCAEIGQGSGTAGGLSCGLGVAITVELDENQICGDVPPTITLAPLCGELTTGTAVGRLDHVANTQGMIGPTTLTGVPSSCTDLRAETVSGTTLVGHLAFFGSAVGDILAENVFVCQ